MVERALAIAIAVIALGGPARADDWHQAHVGHIALADDGVTLCRNQFDFVTTPSKIETLDQPIADCWHVDFATGKVTPAPIPKQSDQKWPEEPAPTAELAPGAVKVCASRSSDCKAIAIPAGDYGLAAVNAARTIVAVQKTPTSEKQINILTFDVATGKPLATLTASGDIVQVLDESLFVQSSCAAPCGGTLYNARTGKRIAEVSADVASANDDNNTHLTGDVWAFKETARERGEPGLLLEHVRTGRRVKRIALDKLVRVDPSGDTEYHVFPARGGLLVVEYQTSHHPYAGDCALVDAKGNVVKRFAAPAWPTP